MVSALATAPWIVLSESAAQTPPPKCGQPGEPPCPKGPQQPQPKQQGPQQPQIKQQGQTQPSPQPPPGQPQLKQGQGQPPTPPQGQPGQRPQTGQGQPPVQQGQGQPLPGQQRPQTGQGQTPVQQGQTPVQQGQTPVQQGQGQPLPGQQRPQTGQGQTPVQQGQGQPQHNLPIPGQGQQLQQGQQQGQPQQQQGQQRGNPVIQQGQGALPPGQAGQLRPQGQGQQQPVMFQRVKPLPGQPAPTGQPAQPGQAPVTQVFVNVQDLRGQRHERTEAGGRVVIEEPDHRMIVREGGQAFVRHDENERLFLFGRGRVEHRGREVYSVIERPDGDQIVTVTDDDGRLIRRFRRERDGREVILIDNHLSVGLGPVVLDIPTPVVNIPREQYIVDMAVAPPPFIYQTLAAPPLVSIERPYSLDEIRYNVALRDRMRRIDVDTINFEFGSWEVGPDEVGRLQLIAQAIQEIVGRNPNEVFLVEGHTDAVGSDVDNLSLSDRRAETVANILTESYQIPPENLTTQGYGAHFLKIQTPDPERRNRRVTLRRITPLLRGGNG